MSRTSYQLSTLESPDMAAICRLYDAVGWSVYTQDPARLEAAIVGSHRVMVAREDGQLIGLIRSISDGVTIAYVQDILVHPDHQRRGIGRAMVQAILEQYAHIRQKVLLTDDRPEQLAFYASLGFHNTRELVQTPLNAFVIMEGVRLS